MSVNNSLKKQPYRIYTNIPVICEILNSEGEITANKTAIAKNLSTEGLCLEMDEALSLGTQLKVKFQLPRSSNTVNAALRIVGVEAVKEEKIFDTETAFTQLADQDRQAISQLVERLNINKILDLAIKNNASDLHLVVGQPPVLRINGELETLEIPFLHAEDITNLVYTIMNDEQIQKFKAVKELDFGIQYDMFTRFRVNLHQQRGYLEATFRVITTKILSFEELRIPETVKDLARHKDGLILIVGPTGSGKTTTIAAMVELINQERKAVIITLERPIEYVHSNDKSIIKQREVGLDTDSFSVALKSSLRQDPNVIVVGELDDMETVKTALIAAEAGYLVIASFHALNTIQAIDRLASIFPVENRKQVLAQLANCIKGIVFQLLLPRKDKKGRVLTTEIVIANEAVKGIIRKDELIQLPTVIQTGGAYKMQSMYDSIRRYMREGTVEEEIAMAYSEEFSRYSQWMR